MHFSIHLIQGNHFAIFSCDKNQIGRIETDCFDSTIRKNLSSFKAIEARVSEREQLPVGQSNHNVAIIVRSIFHACYLGESVKDFYTFHRLSLDIENHDERPLFGPVDAVACEN